MKISLDFFRNKNLDEKTMIFVPKFLIILKVYLDTVLKFWEVWGKKGVFWRGSYSGRSLLYRLNKPCQNGSVIVNILVITLFLSVIISSLIVLANTNLTRARSRIFLLQSQYAAESGADAAIAQFNNGFDAYTGTTSEVTLLTDAQYKSTFTSSVAAGANAKQKIITAVGKVYVPANAPTARFVRTIEVVAERSTSLTTASILSRNIFQVASGVKTIVASDVYVNNYIALDKNTIELVAQNITAAGRYVDVANCSIKGPGKLGPSPVFSDPAQTKTKITTAFNNCITPPGNFSDALFDVAPNQTNVPKIQSTNIPWNQYMDGTYQNAPGGCNDWTTGSFPRDIPSSGNTKKTHYPDNGSNISSSCGTSGDLSLASGQYNIKDHVHIRANLCAASACTPTFYNPDSGAAGLKFVFIEGSAYFDSFNTAAGSGPIVFVVSGANPPSLDSVCPLGGAFTLGSGGIGITVAPQAYIIAKNGLCLNKTKFGATNSLAGFSGNNIYIKTSPGTPFDLSLDLGFPYSSIPVDLSWKASRYRRL